MSSLLILQAACKLGFPVLYGDGSRSVVLQTAGITQPKAVMVMYTGRQKSVQSVERLRQAFPKVRDLLAQFQLKV
jgi:voltage-gated potassium channel Kch